MSSIPNTDALEGRGRGIVMGGGMAGLTAARVLSDHYREVLLIEQDRFENVVEHRRGVPQSRHTHGLLSSGQNTLEKFFPGLFVGLSPAFRNIRGTGSTSVMPTIHPLRAQ
jgi:hypothetical protein